MNNPVPSQHYDISGVGGAQARISYTPIFGRPSGSQGLFMVLRSTVEAMEPIEIVSSLDPENNAESKA